MLTYLQIKQNGDIVEKNTKHIDESCLYKYCNYKSNNDFECIHGFKQESSCYMIYGKKSGRANNENKYDLPPPIDSILLFGTLCILKKTNDEYAPLSMKEWNQVYETLFGGFEDIDESSEERSMDSEIYSDEDYTKEGYLKDDFVVEDDELEEEEYV